MVSSALAFFAGSEEFKIGLIGCSHRGTRAAAQLLQTKGPAKLWALGDLFADKVEYSYNLLKEGTGRTYDTEPFKSMADKMDIPPDRQFTGFDAYQQVIDSGVNVVILASMPQFYPEHFRTSVEANKHVFLEKPAAVDPVGIRSIIETSKKAKEKNLTVVAGTQRRHQDYYLEVMKRIHDGALGEILTAQCYWLAAGGSDWGNPKQPGMSDMEWQIRNWRVHTWLCGDHINEQHIHNLDIINWALNSHPVRCLGTGGRQVRIGENKGNVFDHFTLEFEYPNGIKVLSFCSQINGTSHRIGENIVGTAGTAEMNMNRGLIMARGKIQGENSYSFKERPKSPYQQEMDDFADSIRNNKGANEGVQLAETTMTAIMGRMAAYTGQTVDWNRLMNDSKLDLSPEKLELGDLPVAPPAIPGKTKLV